MATCRWLYCTWMPLFSSLFSFHFPTHHRQLLAGSDHTNASHHHHDDADDDTGWTKTMLGLGLEEPMQ